MDTNKTLIESIDAKTLYEMELKPSRVVIQGLITQGLNILGGSPKIGKSNMVLDACICVSKGEDYWHFKTTQGTVLYLEPVVNKLSPTFESDYSALLCCGGSS